jgi:hypothetical protein
MNDTAPALHLVQQPSPPRPSGHLRGHARCKPPRAMRTFLTITLCSTLALAGCEKAKGKSSGPLGDDDIALLKDLPGGNVALIGGNYMKMQNFMQGSLGKMAEDLMEKATGDREGMKKWMDCFAEMKQLKIAGGVAIAAGMEMRLAFKGTTVEAVDACAKRAGFTHTLDPDKKYVEIEVPGPGGVTFAQGYLQLADGAVYNRQNLALGLLPSIETASRSELEADAAKTKTSNAAGDKQLVALAGKANRSQTFWFAGSGKGTPAADKIGDVYGSFDIDSGLAADVTVGFTDGKLAGQLEDGLEQAKKMSNQLPPDIRGIIDDVSLHRDGDSVRIVAKLSDSQLKALTRMGGLGAGID